jgi:hypothetical protein
LVDHRLHAGNASGWIVSDKDRVRSARWSDARRRRQSDKDLLIELCIKRWNRAWTDEFVRVLEGRDDYPGNSDASDLVRSLMENRRYHSSVRSRLRKFWGR